MPVTIPARRRVVVVQVPRGERRELEERRAAIEQLVDALAHRQLALLAMALRRTGRRPPRLTAAVRSRSSATSAVSRAWLSRNSSDRGSICVSMTSMVATRWTAV